MENEERQAGGSLDAASSLVPDSALFILHFAFFILHRS